MARSLFSHAFGLKRAVWFNGFITVIDMALAQVRNATFGRYRDALVLGSFREDVCFVGGIDAVFQSPSLSHFCRARVPGGFIPWIWPDAGARTEKFARRAAGEFAAGRAASAMVQLGRAIHPLIDMSCPVHAQGVLHTTDPFEWCVEVMGERLRALTVPAAPAFERYAEATLAMARLGQSVAADATNSPWGQWLRRAGLRAAVNQSLARQQAALLIPAAASHTAALLELFVARTGASDVVSGTAPLAETLAALQMSRPGLRRWFAQLRRFCGRHGGAGRYPDLLDLVERCERALDHPQRTRSNHGKGE